MSLHENGVEAEDVGIIIPPPDVKEILETTAAFVGKNPALEARVLQEHNDDPRFFFLNGSDPYHAYYRSKVEEIRQANSDSKLKEASAANGEKGNDVGAERKENGSAGGPKDQQDNAKAAEKDTDGKTTTEGKAVVSFLKSIEAKEEAARPEPREPPPEDLFTIINVNPPPHALGLDVMKLTAQFVAVHGQEFLATLAGKEARNSLFDFLKPLHPHFIVFQRLVDAYRVILDTGEQGAALLATVEAQRDEEAVLAEAWYRRDWECQRAEREHEAALDAGERARAAQIDWHDFVVLETVDVDEDEAGLPAPVADAEQLPKILAAAQRAQREAEQNRGGVDMEVDGAGRGAVVTADVGADIPADRIRKEADAGLRDEGGRGAEARVELPSGQRVAASAAEAWVRAELLDPSYKGERARAAEKNRVQNLAGGDEMARSLARWGAARNEEGVYNRGDLQSALAGRARAPAAEADRTVARAEPSGPQIPVERDEGVSRAAKKARVEKAVDALTKAADAGEAEGVAEGGAGEAEVMEGMVGAAEWVERQGGTAVVRVKLPEHGNREWELRGQEMEMSMKLKSSVKKLKAALARLTRLPANKQKLLLEGVGFLKDGMSLAYYNVGDGAVISVEVKERGGRRRQARAEE